MRISILISSNSNLLCTFSPLVPLYISIFIPLYLSLSISICRGKDKCEPMPPPYTKLTEEETNLKGYMHAALKEEHTVTNNMEMIVSEANQGTMKKGVCEC